MIQTIRKTPIYRVLIWSALVLCILLSYYVVSEMGIGLITYGDSVQYWAAAKLMLIGSNPYSPDQVLELRHQAGNFHDFPPGAISMMLYPPWSIPFILPFGIFNYPLSRLFWLIFNISMIISSVRLIFLMYAGHKNHLYIAYLVSIFFAPTLIILGMGHITTLHLLGIVGFLYFIRRPSNTNYIFAGTCASLLLIKPQLQYLLLFALLIWTIDKRKWLIIVGGATSIITLTLISLIINPSVLTQYWYSLNNYPVGTWVTPTIGSVLRGLLGWDYEWLQILPMIFGIVWFIYHWRNNRKTWDWIEEMPLLLLVCVVTSPYTWTYDMVVLLIPVLSLVPKIININRDIRIWIIIAIYFISNVLTYYLHRFLPDHWYFWFAPLLLILYLVARKLIQDDLAIQKNLGFESDQTSQSLAR